MGAIIPSQNFIVGDVKITGGSLLIDLNEGIMQGTPAGNSAGFFDASNNCTVGYMNDLQMWAANTHRMTVTANGLRTAGSAHTLRDMRQTAHAYALITLSGGVPSLVGSASYNIASVTDVGVGIYQLNYTLALAAADNGVLTGACYGAAVVGTVGGIAGQSAATLYVYDSAGALADKSCQAIIIGLRNA